MLKHVLHDNVIKLLVKLRVKQRVKLRAGDYFNTLFDT